MEYIVVPEDVNKEVLEDKLYHKVEAMLKAQEYATMRPGTKILIFRCIGSVFVPKNPEWGLVPMPPIY